MQICGKKKRINFDKKETVLSVLEIVKNISEPK